MTESRSFVISEQNSLARCTADAKDSKKHTQLFEYIWIKLKDVSTIQRNLQSSWRNASQHFHWSDGERRIAGVRRPGDPGKTPVRTSRSQVSVYVYMDEKIQFFNHLDLCNVIYVIFLCCIISTWARAANIIITVMIIIVFKARLGVESHNVWEKPAN